jgi:plastocyanin
VASFPFYFDVYYSNAEIVSPGGFTEVATLGISHGLAANSEKVTLTATAPAGITVQYTPASPVVLPGSQSLNVTLIVEASSTAALGNDSITIKGVSGTDSQSATFNLRVVQYRVVMEQSQFLPQTLNVTVGGTVYWQNLDGPVSSGCAGEASSGNGQHNVVFTTLPAANSSAISQFQVYSYTFTTPGSYFYYSSLNTDQLMNGTINVLSAAGGIGDVPAIPAFSNLKGGDPSIPAAVPIASTGTEPPGTLDEPSPVMQGGPVALSSHAPSLTSLVSDAGAAGLLGLVLSCAAMVMVTLGKRTMTAIGIRSGMSIASRPRDRVTPVAPPTK